MWDSWTENQAPPAWLVEASSMFAPEEQKTLIGHAAPEITGQALGGEPFQLSRLKGDVVVLDFWGTWCGPCFLEMAFLEQLKASLSGKKVEIWTITEDSAEKAKRSLAERKRTLPNAIVARDTAFRAYGIENIPQVVIIDRKGIVAHQWAGLTSEKQLGESIEALLAQ